MADRQAHTVREASPTGTYPDRLERSHEVRKLAYIIGSALVVASRACGGSSGDDKPAAPSVTNIGATNGATSVPSPAPKPAGPGNTFEDGAWIVGVDIQSGTYSTKDIAPAGCYWEVYAPGKRGSGLPEANQFLTNGGRPRATLKANQEFESRGCGTWVKQA